MKTFRSGYKRRLGLKIISLITLLCFSLNEIALAEGGASFWKSTIVDQASLHNLTTGSSLIEQIYLSKEVGEIQKTFIGTSSEVVIHIQDAHANYDAQQNIAKIIRYLVGRHGIGLVNVEGTPRGKIQTDVLASFPDATIRKVVSEDLLRRAKITGPEFLALTTPKPFSLYGIENESLYEENRHAFQDALSISREESQWLSSLRQTMEVLARRLFSKNLWSLFNLKKAAEESSEHLIEFATVLLDEAKGFDISLEPYSGLQKLQEMKSLEETINFSVAEKESEKLLEELRKGLRPAELAFFVTQTVQFRLKKISRSEFYSYLSRLASQKNRDLKEYPNASQLFYYTHLHDNLGGEIFQELEQLESAVKEKMLSGDMEKRLDLLLQGLTVLERLFTLSLTKDDVAFFYGHRELFQAKAFTDFIKKAEAHTKIPLNRSLPNGTFKIDRRIETVQKFYEVAIQRDQVLFSNSIQNMQSLNVASSIVVTGGFHTPGIEKALEEKGISYMVITPRLKLPEEEEAQNRLYQESVLRTPSSFEKFIADKFVVTNPPKFRDPRYQLAARSLLQLQGIETDGPLSKETKQNFAFVASVAALFKAISLLNERKEVSAFKEMMDFVIGEDAPMVSRRVEDQAVRLILGNSFPGSSTTSVLFAVSDGKISEKIEGKLGLLSRDLIEKNIFQVPDGRGGKSVLQVSIYSSSKEKFQAIVEGESAVLPVTVSKKPSKQTTLKSEKKSLFQQSLSDRARAASQSKGIRNKKEKAKTAVVTQAKSLGLERDQKSEVKAVTAPVSPAASPIRWGLAASTAASLFFGALYGGLPGLLLMPFAFRLSWVFATLLNEWAHLGMAYVLGFGSSFLHSQNFLGNMSLQDWLKRLNPLQLRAEQDSAYSSAAQFESNLDRSTDWMIRTSGWVMSAGFWIGLSVLTVTFPSVGIVALGAFFAFAESSLTDLLGAKICGVYGCGNVGVYRIRQDSLDGHLIDPVTNDILEKMGLVTRVRGEQAEGRTAFFGASPLTSEDGSEVRDSFAGVIRAHRHRMVNSKRDHLPVESRNRFEKSLGWKRFLNWGLKPIRVNDEKVADFVVEHYRFGTSSVPAESETHPHVWMPGREVFVWKLQDGKLTRRKMFLENHISHNGDFDALETFGENWSNEHVGLWLERVLDTPNNTEGDSPKIAGMIDLLFTQGMWDASLRLAYQITIQSRKAAFDGKDIPERDPNLSKEEYKSLVNAIPNTAPSSKVIKEWAQVFERVFSHIQFPQDMKDVKDFVKISERYPQQLEELKKRLLLEVKNDPAFQKWLPDKSDEKLTKFVETSIKMFFANDLFRATRKFIDRAEGTFGLMAASTLKPDGPVLVSKGNPLAIGFSDDGSTLGFVSEAAALKVDNFKYFQLRYSMDQMNGEIANVIVKPDGKFGITLWDVAKREMKDGTKVFPDSPRYVRLTNNPLITPLPSQNKSLEDRKGKRQKGIPDPRSNPVGADLRDIPKVESEILKDWSDPQSYNRQTMEDFVTFLVEADDRREREKKNAASPEEVQMTDVLFVGIGDSLRIAENDMAAGQKIFPGLKMGRTSANKVLAALGKITRNGNTVFPETIEIVDGNSKYVIGKKTVVVFVSQSGQTFPTTLSIAKLQEFQENPKDPAQRGRVFVVTGEMDTPAGEAVGQIYRSNHKPESKGAPFTKRIFTNGSGRRPSEASTVATGALHSTLAQLFIRSALELKKRLSQKANPLGMRLEEKDLEGMLRYEEKILDKTLPAIFGWDDSGARVETDFHKELVAVGRRYAKDVLESPKVWAVMASYIALSVATGYPLFFTLSHLGMWTGLTDGAWLGLTAVQVLLKTFDSLFYIFFVPTLIYGLRFFEGRQILDRVLGTRGFIYGDTPANHLVANGYVTRLAALSYSIATIFFKSGNPQDHFVHDLSHQVVRGSRVLIGVPETAAKGAVQMSAAQTRGIRNLPFAWLLTKLGFKPVGAQVITLSHSKDIKPSATDQNLVIPTPSGILNATGNISDKELKKAVEKRNELIAELNEMFFNSHNRLRAAWVIYYEMFWRISSFWPLTYSMSRTQSGTRIASTASPESGAAVVGLRHPEADEFSKLKNTTILLKIQEPLPKNMVANSHTPSLPPEKDVVVVQPRAKIKPPALRTPAQDDDALKRALAELDKLHSELDSEGSSLGTAKDKEAVLRIMEAIEAVEKMELLAKSAALPEKSFLVIDARRLIGDEDLKNGKFFASLENVVTNSSSQGLVTITGLDPKMMKTLNSQLPSEMRLKIRLTDKTTMEVVKSLTVQSKSSQATIVVLHADPGSGGSFKSLGGNVFEMLYDSQDSLMRNILVKRFAIGIAGKLALYGDEAVKLLKQKGELPLFIKDSRFFQMNRSSLGELIIAALFASELSRRAFEKAA